MKVWVNGTFDIIHIGHIKMLEYAASFGEVRVGVDTDSRVKEKKGSKRPFNTLANRIDFLRSIKYVNTVVPFNSDEELIENIKFYSPDILIVGEEYKDKRVIGSSHVPKVIFYPRVGSFSTSKILNHE
jgi:D-beta-D-heptose 7-phosphate kinase/D-beta-D-heptose 1-phosphate adenosyltransferase